MEGGFGVYWKGLDVQEVCPPNELCAVFSPFPIISLDHLKQALLYYDRIILINTFYDFIDHYRWTEFARRSPIFLSYVWMHFRKRLPLKMADLAALNEEAWSSDLLPYEKQQRQYELWDMMRRFEERLYREFNSQVAILREEGLLWNYDPPLIHQQFLCEWMNNYFPDSGDANSKLLPVLISLIYGSALDRPYISDIPGAGSLDIDQVVNATAKVHSRPTSKLIDKIVHAFAFERIMMSIPSLEAHSFDDILEVRYELESDLIEFRQLMISIAREVETDWSLDRLKTDNFDRVIGQKVQSISRRMELRLKEHKGKFARRVSFGVGKAATPVLIGAYFGLPPWIPLLASMGTFSADFVDILLDYHQDRGQTYYDSQLSYLWRLPRALS